MAYEDLIEDVVATQRTLLGDGAVVIASGVDGLEMNGDGEVESLRGDGVDVLDDLVDEYADDLGEVATARARTVAADYEGDLELPRSLE